jgi:hypothetical protein
MPRLAELVVRMKDLEEVHAVIEALGVAVMALEEIRHQFPDTESIDVRIGRYDLAREVAEEATLAIVCSRRSPMRRSSRRESGDDGVADDRA